MKISDVLCIAAVAITTLAFASSITDTSTTRRRTPRRPSLGDRYGLAGSGVIGSVTFHSSGQFNVRITSTGRYRNRYNLAQLLREKIESNLRNNTFMTPSQALDVACGQIASFSGLSLYSI